MAKMTVKELLAVLDGETDERAHRLPELRAMPTRALHPLHVYLLERGIGIAEGARYLGMSERALREIIAWRSRPRVRRRTYIAEQLGFEGDALFPSSDARAAR